MLEPKKPGEVDSDTGDATQQQDSTNQVDSQDMNIKEGDGRLPEEQPPGGF